MAIDPTRQELQHWRKDHPEGATGKPQTPNEVDQTDESMKAAEITEAGDVMTRRDDGNRRASTAGDRPLNKQK